MPHSKLQLRDLTDQSEQHLIQQVQNSKLHHLFVWKDGFRLALFSNLSKQITSRSESNSREVRNQHLAKPAGSHGHSFVTESPGSQIQGHSRQVFLCLKPTIYSFAFNDTIPKPAGRPIEHLPFGTTYSVFLPCLRFPHIHRVANSGPIQHHPFQSPPKFPASNGTPCETWVS